jgi:hypothetical protein
LRLNDSNEWGNILTKIIGKEVFIISDYKTEDKEIGELYKSFKRYYKLPKNYWEDIEKSKSIRYYLTPQEFLEYKALWCNKLSDNHFGYDDKEYRIYMNISIENSIYDIIDKNRCHYVDEGCKCSICNNAREKIKLILKQKKELNIKINHNDLKTQHQIKTYIDFKYESNKLRVKNIEKKKVLKDLSSMSVICNR